jgi:hypothetical protein
MASRFEAVKLFRIELISRQKAAVCPMPVDSVYDIHRFDHDCAACAAENGSTASVDKGSTASVNKKL